MIDRARGNEPVATSLQEYGRGIAGGLLFSLPLLYTMEVWWTGFLAEPLTLLICIAVTFLLLLGYNRYGGIRSDIRFLDVAIDSVEEFGIGFLLATLVLFLLGRITSDMPANEILGKIIIESMLVSIGVSVGTAQLGLANGDSKNEDEQDSQQGESQPQESPHTLKHMVLGFCGAILFASNIAPTEEIVIIAIESPIWKLIGLSFLSLSVGALILYFSSFHGSDHHYPWSGSVAGALVVISTYAVALLASAMLLWFFGRFNDVSLSVGISQVIVLGFAGNLGASAGRLLIE